MRRTATAATPSGASFAGCAVVESEAPAAPLMAYISMRIFHLHDQFLLHTLDK